MKKNKICRESQSDCHHIGNSSADLVNNMDKNSIAANLLQAKPTETPHLFGGEYSHSHNVSNVVTAELERKRIDHALVKLYDYVNKQDWENAKTGYQKLFRVYVKAAALGVPVGHALSMAMTIVEKHNIKTRPSEMFPQMQRAYAHVSENIEKDWSDFMIRGVSIPSITFDANVLEDAIDGFPVATYDMLKCRSTMWAENAGEFLDALYHKAEKVFISVTTVADKPRFFRTSKHRTPCGMHSDNGVFFLINPISGEWHERSDLRNGGSYRCAECITSYKYMLLESDLEEYQMQWMQFLCALKLPIVSIVTSGGRSVHALVRVNASCKREWNTFRNEHLQYLVEHGADRAAMSAVRFSRLPFYLRGETGEMQQLLYLNPEADGTPIFEQKGGAL